MNHRGDIVESGEGNNESKIYTGASGIVLPVKNKLSYPPEFQDKSRLEYYSSLFNTIEINSSFYKLPMARTVEKWAATVPEDFKFTFKLWKEVTHNKELLFDPHNIHSYFENFAAASRKGCVLVQFPPSIDIARQLQFQRLLTEIQSANRDKWNIAIEFRNQTWYEPEIFDLVHEHGATVVIQDLPASATPTPDGLPDVVYVRFHGPNGGYRGSYPEDFLSEYAYYINDWKEEGKEVFVYFNNTMGDAANNLISLNLYLSALF